MDPAVDRAKEMQAPLAPVGLARLRDRLRNAFGRQALANRPPMEVLVLGLAGAAGPGGERAAQALKQGFRPWSKLLSTAPELVAAALRPVEPDLGRALARAERMRSVLRRLAARSGGLTLDFLAGLSAQAAWDWLEEALGLAPALIVAILTCGQIRHRVALPSAGAVRVLLRQGRVETGCDDAAAAGRLLYETAPPEWTGVDLAELCALLKILADSLCHEARPECGACPVAEACPSASRSASAPPSKGVGALTYLRRRIARLEGEGASAPVAGLQLGGEAFWPAVFPQGLPFGVHQVAPGQGVGQGAAPLILAIAAALAVEPRGATGPRSPGQEREGRFLRRKPPPPDPSAAVRLLLVQEVDALVEHGELYPPGLLALGLDPACAAFVSVGSGGEVLRVVDEALKLKAAPVLVAELRRGEGLADLAVSRRLNLSARRAGALLFLITPDLSNTSAALTRWRVASAPTQARGQFSDRRLGAPAFTLDLVRNRLGPTGTWTVEWDSHEQRFRTPEPAAAPLAVGHGLRPLPAPALPPPVDRPAVAAEGARAAA